MPSGVSLPLVSAAGPILDPKMVIISPGATGPVVKPAAFMTPACGIWPPGTARVRPTRIAIFAAVAVFVTVMVPL